MTQNIKTKHRNIWKWLFIILLAANIAFFGSIAFRLIDNGKTGTSPATSLPDSVQIGTLSTTRTELNQAVTAYLSDEVKESNYTFYATQTQMVFEGHYKLLGYSIPLTCYFTPRKTSDGNISLKLTSFHAGSLSLPNREILSYIKSSVALPKIVSVDAKNETLTLNLTDLATPATANTYLKVDQLDLPSDTISFTIFKKTR